MAIKVMSRVWDLSKQTNGNMLLLLAIADHADDDGVCWPSLDRLAEKTRVSKRQAIRNAQALESSGELFIESGGGRHIKNRYFVTVGLNSQEVQRVLITRFDLQPNEAQRVANIIENRRNGDTDDTIYNEAETVTSEVKTVTSMAETVTSMARNGDIDVTRTVIEPPKNHQATATTAPPESLDSDFSKICTLYESEIGFLSPLISDTIKDDIKTYSVSWIELAVPRAVAANKRSWRYVQGILKNWKSQGGPQNDKPKGAQPNGHETRYPPAAPIDTEAYRYLEAQNAANTGTAGRTGPPASRDRPAE